MSQLNLHNSVRDPSFMNEAVAYRLFRDGGVPAEELPLRCSSRGDEAHFCFRRALPLPGE